MDSGGNLTLARPVESGEGKREKKKRREGEGRIEGWPPHV